MFAHLHAGGNLYFIAGIVKTNRGKWEKTKEEEGESQACPLLLEQLEVLARHCVKAPFLSGSVCPAFSVSLVSTLLGDNGAVPWHGMLLHCVRTASTVPSAY